LCTNWLYLQHYTSTGTHGQQNTKPVLQMSFLITRHHPMILFQIISLLILSF